MWDDNALLRAISTPVEVDYAAPPVSPWYGTDPMREIEQKKGAVAKGLNFNDIGGGETYHKGPVIHRGERAARLALLMNGGEPDAISYTAAKQPVSVGGASHWTHFALAAPPGQYDMYNQVAGSGDWGGGVGTHSTISSTPMDQRLPRDYGKSRQSPVELPDVVKYMTGFGRGSK